MEEKKKSGYGCLILLLAIPGLLWNAWCISVMWGWFVFPVFGIAAPSLKTIIGVDLIVSLIVSQYTGPMDTEEQFRSKVTGIVMKPALILGVGWVVKTWL